MQCAFTLDHWRIHSRQKTCWQFSRVATDFPPKELRQIRHLSESRVGMQSLLFAPVSCLTKMVLSIVYLLSFEWENGMLYAIVFHDLWSRGTMRQIIERQKRKFHTI